MNNEKVYNMAFAKVYPLLIAKAEKKGRARTEVLEVTAWLTGTRWSKFKPRLQPM